MALTKRGAFTIMDEVSIIHTRQPKLQQKLLATCWGSWFRWHQSKRCTLNRSTSTAYPRRRDVSRRRQPLLFVCFVFSAFCFVVSNGHLGSAQYSSTWCAMFVDPATQCRPSLATTDFTFLIGVAAHGPAPLNSMGFPLARWRAVVCCFKDFHYIEQQIR